jgi:DNA-binding NtrC family response regulator
MCADRFTPEGEQAVKESTTVLIADDDSTIRHAIAEYLSCHGYQIREADSFAATETVYQEARPDITILDNRLPDGDAIQLIPRLRAIDPRCKPILLTGFGSIDLAVQAMKAGAESFLTKPVNLNELRALVEKVADERLAQERQRGSSPNPIVDPFIGCSPAMAALREEAKRLADSSTPVLIYGETGAGKGMLARWIHNNGPRAEQQLVPINCANLGGALLGSELFGHEKGAFTGANSAKPGLLEVADEGTVLLDEIGDMPESVQPKLLTVLEEKRFRRIGGNTERTVDIRLIAATNRDLEKLVEQGGFRSDLYFRIATFPLHVPPLRERIDDIPALAGDLLKLLAADHGREESTLSRPAVEKLKSFRWPGNVRQLRNVLERALLLSDKAEIAAEALQIQAESAQNAGGGPIGTDTTLEEIERQHISAVLDRYDGNVVCAAEVLGIPRSTLYTRIRRLGIERNRSGDR